MNEKSAFYNGTFQTLCRMCNSRCGVEVHIKDGVMTDITPSENNPVNNGRLCPRGKSALDVFYHPDRILKPLKRQPDGSFEEIPLARALDEIADRMQTIKDEYGARALGVWKGEGVGFQQQEGLVRRFATAFGTPNYFSNDSACYNGRYLGHALVKGYYNPFPQFSKAKLIILFGTNPPVCHPPFMKEFADAKANGASLVVVDPRLNPIGCWADLFVQPNPGTDGAVCWGLIRLMIQSGQYDREFVERYTIGFDELAAYAERFTPEYVEAETGIYVDVLKRMADMIARSRPHISFYCGAGLEHYENGVNSVRTMVALACLCGNLDIECGMFWSQKPDLAKLILDDEICLEELEPIGAKAYPALYHFTKECHSMMAMDYMLGHGDYPLRGMIITAANPVISNPNTDKVKRALACLDLLVVHDFFMTQTSRLAHYVLPAATFLERSELHYNDKYQLLFLTPKLAARPGVLDPYRLWRELAKRLGFGETYFPWENEAALNRYLLEPSGISEDDLKAHPEGVPYKPMIYKKYETRPFPTPSGKVEFTSSYLKNLGLPEIPEYSPLPHHQRTKEFPLLLTTGGRMTLFYGSRHQNIAKFRRIHPKAELEIHPDDAARLGISQGDRVRVVSKIGELELTARVVHRVELLEGVVEAYHGWEEWPVNRLTHDDVNDPISGFPMLKGVPVRVEKVE